MAKVDPCLKYEVMITQLTEPTDSFSDDDLVFFANHPENCQLGIHSYAAIERRHGLPTGSISNWNGIDDKLPEPIPGAREAYEKKFIAAVLKAASYKKKTRRKPSKKKS